MDVILLQKVANLGNIGDRVKVKSGYGRNFLLPEGKATLATPANVARSRRAAPSSKRLAREQLHVRAGARGGAEGFPLDASPPRRAPRASCSAPSARRTSPRRCTRAGFKVARSEVRLPNGPLRTVGEHLVTLHLHADVDVPLTVTIVAEE